MSEPDPIEEASEEDIEELLLAIEARITKARRALDRYRLSEDVDDLYLVEVALDHAKRDTGVLIELIEEPPLEEEDE